MSKKNAPLIDSKPNPKHSSIIGGLLPLIGTILFIIATISQAIGGFGEGWEQVFFTNAVIYLIGWAGVGAGISHLFFGKRISKTIGFEKSPYELEVGFADLAMGIVGLLAAGYNHEFAFAIILVSSIYRVGCGIGHIRSIIRDQNFAINNTAILFTNFVVPAFLVITYFQIWG